MHLQKSVDEVQDFRFCVGGKLSLVTGRASSALAQMSIEVSLCLVQTLAHNSHNKQGGVNSPEFFGCYIDDISDISDKAA